MYAGVVGLGLYAPHFGKKLMNIMKLEMPEMPAPKQGGMLDAIHRGRFVDYLAGIDWQEKREAQIENEIDHQLMLSSNDSEFKHEEEIENEVNNMLMEQ